MSTNQPQTPPTNPVNPANPVSTQPDILDPPQEEITRTPVIQTTPVPQKATAEWEDRIRQVESKQNTTSTGLDTLRTRVNKALTAIFDLPAKLKANTVDTTDSISNKLADYRKAMKGEGDQGGEMFILGAKHLELLNEVRTNNPALYCLIIKVADCWTSASLAPAYLKCAGDIANIDKCPFPNKTLAMQMMINLLLIYKQRPSFNPTALSIIELAKERDIFPNDASVQSFLSRL
jgi:hypothetical protein